MRLSRRQMIVALGAAAIPANGLARPDQQRVLVDRGLPEIDRHLPKGAIAVERAGDPVRQIQSLLACYSRPIAGLTNGSDMLIARGSARERRRKFTVVARHGPLFHWTIAGKAVF